MDRIAPWPNAVQKTALPQPKTKRKSQELALAKSATESKRYTKEKT